MFVKQIVFVEANTMFINANGYALHLNFQLGKLSIMYDGRVHALIIRHSFITYTTCMCVCVYFIMRWANVLKISKRCKNVLKK